MACLVCNGAATSCDQGTSPCALVVPPTGADEKGLALATIDHHQPGLNLATFGMCKSMQNPAVQSATAAAQGVLTPVPCVPVTTSPWSPGADGGDLAGRPLLTDGDELRCAFGGTIKVEQPVATADIA